MENSYYALMHLDDSLRCLCDADTREDVIRQAVEYHTRKSLDNDEYGSFEKEYRLLSEADIETGQDGEIVLIEWETEYDRYPDDVRFDYCVAIGAI